MQISEGEWIVMNLIWHSQPIDAKTVIDQLAHKNNWSAATVKTMLHRLVKKGALSHEQAGKKFLYRAAVRRSECVRKASRSFLKRVFGGEAGPALLHLVRTSKLSDDDVQQLRDLLDSKDSNKGKSKE
jgi:BlaI family penicillinase repressor